MIVAKGNKVHIIYRALYESATRRHFLGEVMAVEGTACRLEGYAFVRDQISESYVKKPGKRTTVVDLAESGYIVNIVDAEVDIASVAYKYQRDMGLVATDGKNFVLDINEFGIKS